MNIKPHVVGLIWVREEDYAAFLGLWADSNKMPQTWELWLKSAEKREQHAKSEGHLVERVYLDPDTFVDWCAVHICSVDAQGRDYFVAVTLAEKYNRH